MTFALRLHPRIEADLVALAERNANSAGVASAVRKLDDIEMALARLAGDPSLGTPAPKMGRDIRTRVEAEAVIAYRVDTRNRAVFVLAVVRDGADWTAWFQGDGLPGFLP